MQVFFISLGFERDENENELNLPATGLAAHQCRIPPSQPQSGQTSVAHKTAAQMRYNKSNE